MRKRILKRLDKIRQQPDHVRMRTASLFTVISGVVIVIMWLTVLLPAQLYLSRGEKGKATNTGSVQGVKTIQQPQQVPYQPSISPTPTPAAIPVGIKE